MEAATEESRQCYSRRGISQRLKRVFSDMDSDNDEKISPKDLKAYLKRFDYAPSKEEVKELVWQGDEDHDGFLAWDEFERAFQRCIHDKAGKEPRELHNVVLFALNLVEGAVKLSLDAASRLTYLEHGREELEAHVAATFGDTHGWRGLALRDFLRCMTIAHLKRPTKPVVAPISRRKLAEKY